MLFPVRVEVRKSRRLRAALFFAHALAFASCLALTSDAAYLVPIVAVLAASMWLSWRDLHCGVLVLRRDGEVDWQKDGATSTPAKVLAGSTAFNWLVVLRLQPTAAGGGARRITLVLLGDSAERNALRRLRLWLRWVCNPSATVSGADR